MSKPDHVRLFIPGPVEVSKDILEAQTEWLVGHRSQEFFDLFASVQAKLRKIYKTRHRVYATAGSGTNFWEGAVLNGVRNPHPILHLDNGIFGERWSKVSRANGKKVEVIKADFGKVIRPEQVAEKLKEKHYDAVAMVYNETSTGMLNPAPEIAEIVRGYPDTFFFVDVVSAICGAPVETDAWGIDVCVASPQKAIGLPPGMGMAAVSDRVLERAKEIEYRGWAYDFLQLESWMVKNSTPATPPVPMFFAADKALGQILEQGLDARVARHAELAQMTRDWAVAQGFGLFAEAPYFSPTVTVIENEPGPGIQYGELDAFLRAHGFVIANGYGPMKQRTFRIAHMGDEQHKYLQEVLDLIAEFMKGKK
ncbi:MAG: alanine--glyoxylate aminotransferase family protein [Anaerolineae bacterium]|nr:alanine--glyoxylate aminotransferase family protein [Anaerolineae bacterium]